MAEFIDFTFTSSTGHNEIHAVKCIPDTPVRGVVQIAHGISEHIGRYPEFMTFLAENGFAVYGNDHLGHGKSARNEAEKGIFAEEGGWNYAVDDMRKLQLIAKKDYPDVPYILLGHSMGSFLTRTFMIRYPGKYDLALLSGTGHQSPALIATGCILSDLMCKTKGVSAPGDVLNKVAFGTYLSRIENPKTPADWLSTDVERVQSYIADADCGFVAKNGMYRDMMHGIRFITDKNNIAKMDVTKPVYFFSGAEDPVGDYGKGVEKAYKAFCDAGCKDVTIRLYPGGRHEMLNEKERAKVSADLLEWINARI